MATNMTSTVVIAGQSATAVQYDGLRLDVLQQAGDYTPSTGSGNAYAISIDAQITAYDEGQVFKFKANFTNTATATLAVNGLAAKTIVRNSTEALLAGDIRSGQIVSVLYDGTNMQMISVPTLAENVYPLVAGASIDSTTNPVSLYVKESDSKVYLLDASAATEAAYSYIGFAVAGQNVSTGSFVAVHIEGAVPNFGTALTAGALYFSSTTPGGISTATSTYGIELGRAISTSTLVAAVGRKIASGTASFSTTTTSAVTIGFRPSKIRVFAVHSGGSDVQSNGGWDTNGGNLCAYTKLPAAGATTTAAWFIYTGDVNLSFSGVITAVTSTGFTLSNTKNTASSIGSVNLLWIAES